ncbi:hypothetical protein [Anaerobacillus alkalilacustris]|uniref:hypothetical protein n=1 Tax=Anaerobacillus alkalilacustris TaxID=393763 RepID=UPI001FE0CB45|nr:hypothetical protein [Anaerobacillus alkalilacustris]
MYIVIELDSDVIGIARLIRGDLEMKRHVTVFRTWRSNEGQGKGIVGIHFGVGKTAQNS